MAGYEKDLGKLVDAKYGDREGWSVKDYLEQAADATGLAAGVLHSLSVAAFNAAVEPIGVPAGEEKARVTMALGVMFMMVEQGLDEYGELITRLLKQHCACAGEAGASSEAVPECARNLEPSEENCAVCDAAMRSGCGLKEV
jgi:hypothetical protein